MSLKTVAKNASWLGLIQGLNYLIPLVTLPVVTHAFGPILYGILAAFNAYGRYVFVIVNYGFDFTGLRAIVRVREDISTLSRTFSAIFSFQILLGTSAVAFFFAALPFVVPHGENYKMVGLIVLLQIFATAATPQWLFVALEQIRGLALAQFVFRLLAAVIIVSSIRAPDDLLFYVSINCTAAAAILVFSLIVITRHHVRWQTPYFTELVSAMRQGAYLFVSNISISLYTSSAPLFVAIALGPAAAGAFGLAERIRQAAASVLGPLRVAIYPLVYRVVGGVETDEGERTQRVFFLAIVALSALISVALFVFAPLIVSLLAGDAFHDAILVLRIVAFLPLLMTLSNRLGYQTLIALGKDRQFMWIVMSTALFGVGGLFLLMSKLGLTGAAFALVAAEIYVTFALAIVVQKRKNILSLFFGKL